MQLAFTLGPIKDYNGIWVLLIFGLYQINTRLNMLRVRDKQQLEISKFIFHILLREEEEPTFLDEEVFLTRRQRNFFENLLLSSVSMGVEYEWKDKTRLGSVYDYCSKISKDESDFIEISKRLTREFKRLHKGSSSDGIFVLAHVSLEVGTVLFMVKMDFTETLQYDLKEIDGKQVAELKDVKNPIAESKQAIQKAAIVNLDADYDWDVFAQDKQIALSYKIADYFKDYLDVREKDAASRLTRQLFKVTSHWTKVNRSNLDPEQDVTTYKGRMTDYLETQTDFDTEEFIRAVIIDDDEVRRIKLQESIRKELEEKELAGRSFVIMRNSVPSSEKKITWTTHHNVKITFEGTPQANNIERRSENNEEIITIRTSRVRSSG